MFSTPAFLLTAFLLAAVQTCFAAATVAPVVTNAAPLQILRTFENWKTACSKLPSNRSLQGRWPPNRLLPLQRFSEFDEVLTAFFAQCQTGTLSQATNWIGPKPTTNAFFNTATAYFLPSATSTSSPAIPFEPYAQKLSVPEDSEIFFRADLHGDVRSLLADLAWLNEKGYLRGFSAARTNFYMVFLGDYTDRGAYGIEVLYTLLRLKLANPERVFLARGNHEEVGLQIRYGFIEEGQRKYGAAFNAGKLERAYDFLPVVIYAGASESFIQCNHGGMEPGFSPRVLLEAPGALSFQLLGPLKQKQFLTDHPEWLAGAGTEARQTAAELLIDFRPDSPVSPTTLGFMWNDFAVLASEPALVNNPQRAFIYGASATQFLLRTSGTSNRHVHAVFRGHQQSSVLDPMMRRLIASRGVFRHWQAADSHALLDAPVGQLSKILERSEMRAIPSGSVWTFNVAPDSVYGERCGFTFDSFGILKLARNFADWRLQVVNVNVEP
jgi:hypothetical protein